MKHENWLFGRDGALFRAAAKGNLSIAEELIKDGANVNTCSKNGYTPLHRAAQHGHIAIVDLLLKSGANPDLRTNENITPLGLAKANKQNDVTKRLSALSK